MKYLDRVSPGDPSIEQQEWRNWREAITRDLVIGRQADRTIGFAAAAGVLAHGVWPLFSSFDVLLREDVSFWAVVVAFLLCLAAAYRPNLFSPLTLLLVALVGGLIDLALYLARGGPFRRHLPRHPISGRPRRRQ